MCTYRLVHFEWDQTRNRINFRKHGLDFETAQLVFDDPGCVTFVERIVDGEQRWQAIGLVEGLILVLVAHTYRVAEGAGIIRIVSARRASRHERKLYEEAQR